MWRVHQRLVWLILLALVSTSCGTPSRGLRTAVAFTDNGTAPASVPAQDNASAERAVRLPPSIVSLASSTEALPAPSPVTPDDRRRMEAGNQYVPPPSIPESPPEMATREHLAPQTNPLTLMMLESLACQHNPTLRQSQTQIDGELGKAIQAGLWPNPTLSYVHEQIGVNGTPGEFVGGTVRQRIVTGHKLDLSRAKFLATTRTAEWRALEQQYRVLNDVRMRYFRARGNFELMLIHQELLKTAEDGVLTQRERYNVGQATQAEIHLANAALQRTRLDLLRRENEYRQSFAQLSASAGVDLPLAPLATPLAGDLTPLAFEEVLAQLITQSPQMRAALQKLESDRITIRREMVEPVPDIVVEGGAGYNFDADESVGSARASIELPLFDWNQGTIRQAESDYLRQQAEVRRIELSLKQELAQTYQDYVTALQFARDYAEVILPETRAAYELQLRSYKDNRISWVEVLRTQEDYYEARTEYVRNLTKWRESEALITGFLLRGGLEAPSAPRPPGHIDSVPKPR